MSRALLSLIAGIIHLVPPVHAKSPGYAKAAAYFEKHQVSKDAPRVLPKKKVAQSDQKPKKKKEDFKIKLAKHPDAGKKKKSEKRKIANVEKKERKSTKKSKHKKKISSAQGR